MSGPPFEFFAITFPGLEPQLAAEAAALGFAVTATSRGGVTMSGDWPEIWRANLCLRGATRILVRLAQFPVIHMSQLDKKSRKLPWADWLKPGVPLRVEATCRKSKIYHQKGAAERVATAASEAIGAPIDAAAALQLKVRIDENLCTISLDTSGEPLHKRGHKAQVNKAPMRETLAALFLRACGYDGSQTLYDPMCGSGTFVIEAAEMALGFAPGRTRDFAFEEFASFDRAAFSALKDTPSEAPQEVIAYGSDRDTGAITMSKNNAARAEVALATQFEAKSISDITPPSDAPGLVIVNPPYGGRIGNKKPLFGLYGSFGTVMKAQFAGWRVGMITADAGLAKATALPFETPSGSIDHGGIRIKLYQAQL